MLLRTDVAALGIRRPAIAAIIGLLLVGAPVAAKAAIIPFAIDPTQSFVSASVTIDLTPISGGIYTSVPQFPDPDGAGPLTGSNKTSLSGTVMADVGPGFSTIAFPGGSAVHYNVNNTPGVGGVPGSYAPFDPVVTDPVYPTSGATPNASYGLETAGPLFWSEVRYDLVADLLGPVRPVASGAFALTPGLDFLVGTGGRIAYSSAVDTDTHNVTGDVLAALGTAGPGVGTWNTTTMTLTIPLESTYTVPLPGGIGFLTYTSNSTLVATPIPEPASWLLWAFGVAALAAWARRAGRKPNAP